MSLDFEPLKVLEPVFYAMKNEARFESIRDVRKYLILLGKFKILSRFCYENRLKKISITREGPEKN